MSSWLTVSFNGSKKVLKTRAEITEILQIINGDVEKVWLYIERIDKYGTKTPTTRKQLGGMIEDLVRYESICDSQLRVNRNRRKLDKHTVEANRRVVEGLQRRVEELREDAMNTSRSVFGVDPTLDDDILQPCDEHSNKQPGIWPKFMANFFEAGRRELSRSNEEYRTRIRMGCQYKGGGITEFVEEQDGEPTQSRWAAPTLGSLTAGSQVEQRLATASSEQNAPAGVLMSGDNESITSIDYYNRYNDVSSGV
ncbi:hypothetical protein FS749_014163 [Ceratobasidium sp. UAMH 11750]|nr:hypothetical protein FS749_014163 [Ceratobasidium sp. UAMH 11750]